MIAFSSVWWMHILTRNSLSSCETVDTKLFIITFSRPTWYSCIKLIHYDLNSSNTSTSNLENISWHKNLISQMKYHQVKNILIIPLRISLQLQQVLYYWSWSDSLTVSELKLLAPNSQKSPSVFNKMIWQKFFMWYDIRNRFSSMTKPYSYKFMNIRINKVQIYIILTIQSQPHSPHKNKQTKRRAWEPGTVKISI